jgi:signal transduction histidine kinase
MFAGAAERLGLDVDAPPLPEEGPREVRRASRAFNEMQGRLRSFVRDRTQMLAAISHDLRTPITRLRLRAEFMEDGEQKDRMLSDLDEIQAMIAATLDFARDDFAGEPRRALDLAVLLRDICDEFRDVGADVTWEGPAHATQVGAPAALKRAFSNLIGNAVNYGGGGAVRLTVEQDFCRILVEDRGPGLAEADLERVFEPFVRAEGSRSRETGGVGLGLAITRSIVRGHGGDVTLANRPEGGLRATVALPAAANP